MWLVCQMWNARLVLHHLYVGAGTLLQDTFLGHFYSPPPRKMITAPTTISNVTHFPLHRVNTMCVIAQRCLLNHT